jgi:hypothetical protein
MKEDFRIGGKKRTSGILWTLLFRLCHCLPATALETAGAFVSFLLCASAPAADYPSWWTSNNVITNVASTNDFAAVNAGQLKWFATNAYDELDEVLPGGAGTNIENIIKSFSLTNNYYAVNIGQLKYTAKPFYDRLIAVGYTNGYPWTATTTDDVDYAAVNIGQVKYVFSFDLTVDNDSDGLANWVETGTSNFVSQLNTGSNPNVSDSDGDETDDGTEVDNRTDPNNSDTNGPVISITCPVSGFTIVP